MKTKFTPDQIARSKELESNISQYLKGADLALSSIIEYHTDKLYLIEFSSFEECSEKLWQISRSRAYQLLNYAKHVKQLSDEPKPQQINTFDVHRVDTLQNEKQFRKSPKTTHPVQDVESTVQPTDPPPKLPCSIPASTPVNLKAYVPGPEHQRPPEPQFQEPSPSELRFADKQSLLEATMAFSDQLCSNPNPPPLIDICRHFLHLINEHLSP